MVGLNFGYVFVLCVGVEVVVGFELGNIDVLVVFG